MKKLLIINVLLFICACTYVQAQINLVRNPGFETHTGCPVSNDQIYLATGWNGLDSNWTLGGTYPALLCLPEYINGCATHSSGQSFPDGAYWYQYPRSGNGMTGCRFYHDGSSLGYPVFDYLQGRLIHTLVAGQSYCVTFYVNRGLGTDYAINNIGAYLDGGYIDTTVHCYSPQTEYTPQILETAIISDTLNWIKIQGSFTANGTEKFITIGEFFDTGHISKIRGTSGMGYYLVDDVSVIASDAVAYGGPDVWVGSGHSTYIGVDSNGDGMPCYWYVLGGTTPIDSGGRIKVTPSATTTYEVVMDLCGVVTRDTVTVHVWAVGVRGVRGAGSEVQVFPNPAVGLLHVEGAEGCEVRVFDVVGREVYGGFSGTNEEVIDISGLTSGVYVLRVVDPISGQQVCRRVVKE